MNVEHSSRGGVERQPMACIGRELGRACAPPRTGSVDDAAYVCFD